MKKFFLCMIGVLVFGEFAHAEPSKSEYAERVRAETLLKNEVSSIKGLSASDATELSNQIITSMKQINTNQLKKGMNCKEISEFVEKNLANQQDVSALKFTSIKYQHADCAVQSSWKK